MKKLISVSLLMLFILSTENVYSQSWQQLENFPGSPRDDGSTFTVGSKYYCGLGRDDGFNCTRDFFVFDAASATWSNSTSLPIGEERQYATGASWNNQGYIFGGAKCDGTFLNDLWLFDPISNGWTVKTALPAAGRGGCLHFILEDTLYIVGGRNDSGILSEVWGYDFTLDLWTQKTDLPGDGIWRGLAFSWQGKGYAGLGKNDLNNQTEFNTEIYSFDPQTQIWSVESNFGLTPRTYIGSAQNENQVFIFGGLTPNNDLLSDFERLDLSDWTKQVLPTFSSDARRGGMSFLYNDIFYTTTGVSQTARLNETWRIYGILNIPEIKESTMTIFPNPATSTCTIKIGNYSGEQIEISSLQGSIIASFKTENNIIVIDLSNFSNGSYFFKAGGNIQKLEILR